MANNAMLVGWNRPVPGRENKALEHFPEFMGYLAAQQKEGNITGFKPVFLDPHGGDLNGFVVIEGDAAKLEKIRDSEIWKNHVTRGVLNMQSFGVIPAVTGDAIQERMTLFAKHI